MRFLELFVDHSWKEDLEHDLPHLVVLKGVEVDIVDLGYVWDERWENYLNHGEAVESYCFAVSGKLYSINKACLRAKGLFLIFISSRPAFEGPFEAMSGTIDMMKSDSNLGMWRPEAEESSKTSFLR